MTERVFPLPNCSGDERIDARDRSTTPAQFVYFDLRSSKLSTPQLKYAVCFNKDPAVVMTDQPICVVRMYNFSLEWDLCTSNDRTLLCAILPPKKKKKKKPNPKNCREEMGAVEKADILPDLEHKRFHGIFPMGGGGRQNVITQVNKQRW